MRFDAAMCGLQSPPIFCPIVADFYSGMVVTVPLFAHQLTPGATAADVKALLSQVSDQVYRKSGIRLEPEVRVW